MFCNLWIMDVVVKLKIIGRKNVKYWSIKRILRKWLMLKYYLFYDLIIGFIYIFNLKSKMIFLWNVFFLFRVVWLLGFVRKLLMCGGWIK